MAEAAYKAAMKTAHSDVGGTNEAARELTWAIETIRRYSHVVRECTDVLRITPVAQAAISALMR